MTSNRSNLSDLEPGKTLQPVAIGTPVGSAFSGDASVVVEVYALGRGITVTGQGCDLSRGQGAFELEAHGKRFVVDPGRAGQSHRLVSTVERDVAAIGHPVEAVDQEHLTEHGNGGVGHGNPPLKTAILSLPQGYGKSSMARELASLIGCVAIVDEWSPDRAITPGALHLTNCEVST